MELCTCIFYIIDGRLLITLKCFRGAFSNLIENMIMRGKKKKGPQRKNLLLHNEF